MEESTPELEEKSAREWDDIIPEDQRRKIEEEEKQREMEDIFMLPRSRSSNKRVRRGRGGRGHLSQGLTLPRRLPSGPGQRQRQRRLQAEAPHVGLGERDGRQRRRQEAEEARPTEGAQKQRGGLHRRRDPQVSRPASARGGDASAAALITVSLTGSLKPTKNLALRWKGKFVNDRSVGAF